MYVSDEQADANGQLCVQLDKNNEWEKLVELVSWDESRGSLLIEGKTKLRKDEKNV